MATAWIVPPLTPSIAGASGIALGHIIVLAHYILPLQRVATDLVLIRLHGGGFVEAQSRS